jgi:hypothetical protein
MAVASRHAQSHTSFLTRKFVDHKQHDCRSPPTRIGGKGTYSRKGTAWRLIVSSRPKARFLPDSRNSSGNYGYILVLYDATYNSLCRTSPLTVHCVLLLSCFWWKTESSALWPRGFSGNPGWMLWQVTNDWTTEMCEVNKEFKVPMLKQWIIVRNSANSLLRYKGCKILAYSHVTR